MVQLQPQLWEVKSGWFTGLGGSPSLLDVLQASERPPLKNLKKKKRPKAPEGWQLRLSSDPHTCGHVHLYYTCTHVNTHRGKGKTERDGRGERNCMWDSEFPISMKFLFFLIFIYSTIHPNHSLSFLHSSQFPPPLIPTSTPLLSSPRREQTSQDISWTQHKVE